jgi:signal transduction histidine kinase
MSFLNGLHLKSKFLAIETIHRVAAETVNSVRDIVWLLHPRETDRVPTIDHLRESAAILLDPLDWTLASDFRDWKLGDEDGRHLVLFFREVLHNIRRHADARQITIHAGQDGDDLVLTVTDDGRGIPADRLDQPSSLRSLRQRAERLGGTVEVRTEADRGTTVILRFVPRAPGSAPQPILYPEPS